MKFGSLNLGRYDFAGYSAFIAYSICSLSIPIVLVAMGKDLNFPLDQGGMSSGGVLHLLRSIAMVVSLMICGIVAGRLGKRKTMGFCMMMTGLGIFLCSFTPGYWLLFPFLLTAGLGEGFCEGIATPFVQDLHQDAPEKYVNIAHSFWSVGIGICVLGGGWLLSAGVSWRYILAAAGFMAILSALTFLWKENPQRRYPENPTVSNASDVWRSSAAIARSPRFWVYCLGMFIGAGAEFCLTFWAAAFLQLSFHATAWVAGLGTAAIALGMFLGRNYFGWIATDRNLKVILLLSSICTIPCTLALALIRPEFFPSQNLMFAALLGLLFLCGIGVAPYWPTLQVYGVKQLPGLDATMLYVYFSAVGVPGCGFFTWLVGILGDKFGLKGAFYLIPITLVFYALLIFLDGWVFPRKSPLSAPRR